MADLTRVIPELSQRITAMMADGKDNHVYFSIACGFRPLADQERLYAAYKADPKHNALAAVPGTSNHGKVVNGVQQDATAVDLDVIPQTPANIAKHLQLAQKWGLYRAVKGEYWHLELDPNRKPLEEDDEDMPGPQGQVDACACRTGGYWIVTKDGGVRAIDGAPFLGSYPGLPPEQRQGDRFFIAIEALPDRIGYRLYASDDAHYDFVA